MHILELIDAVDNLNWYICKKIKFIY
jgi:hypothetical protein